MSSRYARYTWSPTATASLSLKCSGTSFCTATSQRDMKTEATEPTTGFCRASIRLSMPRMNASAAATYWSAEKSRVTLTGTPAAIASSMAGRPSLCPGS